MKWESSPKSAGTSEKSLLAYEVMEQDGIVEEEFMRRQMLVSKAFRPAAPIDDSDLFAGRKPQMFRLIDVVEQPGQHAAIYGGRGVGKTSLAKVMVKTFSGDGTGAVHFTCSTSDTFDSIWRSVFGDLRLTYVRPGLGFTAEAQATVQTAAEMLLGQEEVRPEDVRRSLSVLTTEQNIVVFIDEFDRVNDAHSNTAFADTIKILSDQLVPATLVLVGVADNIDDLIAEHASVLRSLAQIQMPNMSLDELGEIVTKGMAACEMTVEPAFTKQVVDLAQGLPNYVHLVTQNAARVALDAQRRDVRRTDLDRAIERSIESIQQSVLDTYHRATSSNRATLYKEVLLACALANRDEKGTFGSADVRDELTEITGTFRDLPAFAQHLNDFSGKGRRGGVLDKLGENYRYRYRFSDPLLQPYVLMRGHLDGRMPGGSVAQPLPGIS